MRQVQPLELAIQDLAIGRAADGYHPVTLTTTRGAIAPRYYPTPGGHSAALWVGGIGGNWDSPARDLYPRLALDGVEEGIASLRVRFRHPTVLEEAVADALAGLWYLERLGVQAVALTGHSFGGAVVIQAAAARQRAPGRTRRSRSTAPSRRSSIAVSSVAQAPRLSASLRHSCAGASGAIGALASSLL